MNCCACNEADCHLSDAPHVHCAELDDLADRLCGRCGGCDRCCDASACGEEVEVQIDEDYFAPTGDYECGCGAHTWSDF